MIIIKIIILYFIQIRHTDDSPQRVTVYYLIKAEHMPALHLESSNCSHGRQTCLQKPMYDSGYLVSDCRKSGPCNRITAIVKINVMLFSNLTIIVLQVATLNLRSLCNLLLYKIVPGFPYFFISFIIVMPAEASPIFELESFAQ